MRSPCFNTSSRLARRVPQLVHDRSAGSTGADRHLRCEGIRIAAVAEALGGYCRFGLRVAEMEIAARGIVTRGATVTATTHQNKSKELHVAKKRRRTPRLRSHTCLDLCNAFHSLGSCKTRSSALQDASGGVYVQSRYLFSSSKSRKMLPRLWKCTRGHFAVSLCLVPDHPIRDAFTLFH